jgi:hypothetical protein
LRARWCQSATTHGAEVVDEIRKAGGRAAFLAADVVGGDGGVPVLREGERVIVGTHPPISGQTVVAHGGYRSLTVDEVDAIQFVEDGVRGEA